MSESDKLRIGKRKRKKKRREKKTAQNHHGDKRPTLNLKAVPSLASVMTGS
jgi:hypothetical protein